MKTETPDALLAAEVSRRGLMKTTAIGGLADGQQRVNASVQPYCQCC
ncbi:Dimethyl sulfoxide reductase DmsA precursor [Kluyvera cryocrescens]|uniref:Dimethyl sulfoxide reductase DmsA n=1 Tax=Kluyvera cryocrescens TaxID=580 RepID=A0A485AAX8_KLUCR|nr:Dimethyl sulfoxide reductase DmsA precursor [Kluyvera cryocrescens]